MSCSLTIGAISSRVGIRATVPLKLSLSSVSQSGTGVICVNSKLRAARLRLRGLSFTDTAARKPETEDDVIHPRLEQLQEHFTGNATSALSDREVATKLLLEDSVL